MSENQRVELRGLKVGWNDDRTERLLADVHGQLGRRQKLGRVALAAAALSSLLVVLFITLRGDRTTQTASSTTGSGAQLAAPSALKLREGSLLTFEPATSEVRVEEESDARVRVELVRGSARYDVVPKAQRTFEVHAGSVTVTVVGTEFAVERRAERTWVEVFRGKVRVSWGEGQQALLAQGESGLFPPPGAASSAPNVAAERPDAGAPALGAQQASQAYRSHLARRDYRGAYAVLSRNPTLAGDTVKELLLAADVARLSDHPSEAVPYLQRIVRDHAQDERAPLAAFTLGRTLSGLGRTREAMNMFARVRSAWPRSPLGEDALLRQAEAASKLGDIAAAARLAEQYEHDYPNGRRRAEVRRYARLP